MIDKRMKAYQDFGDFVSGFVRDLNQLSEDGWAVLVEGRRDERALRELGYAGRMATVSSFSRSGPRAFGGSARVVILTDLDREGGTLAARFVKKLSHEGLATSLSERRRLKAASKGVFLHVENLRRFSETAGLNRGRQEFITP
jgi:5S rRNA maturation endonuclease (ribonuclease M5)